MENNNDLKEMYVTDEEDGVVTGGFPVRRNAMLRFSFPDKSRNYAQHTMLNIQDESVVPAEAKGKLSITPAAARKLAEELLAGTDMAVWDIFLTDDENRGRYDGIVSDAERYVYRLLCVRRVNGVDCAYIRNRSFANSGKTESLAGMTPSWHYETLELYVDDEGIFNFDWWSPLAVEEIITEDSQLLPFARIQEIFEKMMLVKHEPKAKAEHFFATRIEVYRVILSLQRICEQDSFETGLLVPVWNFCGRVYYTMTGSDTEGTDGGYWDGISESLLTINAIDGSIIDINAGY